MANPNPVRRKLASDAMSDRMKAKFPVYVARQRQPGEALPHASSVMDKKNVYKPPVWVAPIR